MLPSHAARTPCLADTQLIPGNPAAAPQHPLHHHPCSPYLPIWGKAPECAGPPVLTGQGCDARVLRPELCCDVGALWEGRAGQCCCAQSTEVQALLRPGDTDGRALELPMWTLVLWREDRDPEMGMEPVQAAEL